MLENHRKLVFTAAYFVIFCCSASAAFSVFAKPLQVVTNGSASQVMFTLTIYQFFMALFGIISGRIVDKIGPRMVVYVGGFVFGLGWCLTAFSTSIPTLYLYCGVIAGMGNGLLYNPSLNTALRWFPEKRGLMSGILLTAASLGPLILAKAGAILSEIFGTYGFIYIGATFLIIIWAVAWKMDVPAKDWLPQGFTPKTVTLGKMEQKNYTASEMLKTPLFWCLFILFSIACTAGIMMIGSLSPIAQKQLNMTPIVAANMVAVNLIANICGRLLVGRLCDKLGELKTLMGILLLTIISLFGLMNATSVFMFVPFLIILGASFGGVLVVFPPLTSKCFGMQHFGFNYGIMFFAYAAGALLGPQIAALAVNQDLGIFAYRQAYITSAGVAIIGLIITLFLIKKFNQKN